MPVLYSALALQAGTALTSEVTQKKVVLRDICCPCFAAGTAGARQC